MVVHSLVIAALLSFATGLLLYSNQLEEPTQIVVTPSPVATDSPVANPTPTSTNPSGKPTARPTAKPTPTPTPQPTPTPTPLPDFGIAATSPQEVLEKARMSIGRVDPFKSITPPDLPDLETAISPDELAFVPPPSLPDTPKGIKVYATPNPKVAPPQLADGLTLKAIINGGLDPVAIVDVEGSSELIRVGERLPGNILVTSILYKEKSIKLSRGNESATLIIETEEEE